MLKPFKLITARNLEEALQSAVQGYKVVCGGDGCFRNDA